MAYVIYLLHREKFLNLPFLQSELERLVIYETKHPVLFLFFFEVIFLLLTSFSIPGSILLTFLAGVIFGNFWGCLLVTFNCALGATIAFLMARFFLKESLEIKFEQQFKKLQNSLSKNGLWYLWMLRMLPGSPFVLINLLMGLTNIKLIHFFSITFLGMLPGNFIFVYAGHRILEIDKVWKILTPQLFLVLLLMGIIPILVRHMRGI